MPNLTEKGQYAFNAIREHFPTGSFSAAELSAAVGEKIVAATLNGVATKGYLIKEGGSPVKYRLIENVDEILSDEEEASKGCDNSNLVKAKKVKNDEFYTRYEDIEAEVMKYKKAFRGKVVYLPCDDPAEKKSEFWSFFVNNFETFGLKKLIATHYDESGKAYKIWIDGDTTGNHCIDDGDALQEDLEGNGDFRSSECIAILDECDIVCTNPPFSLFREFVDLLLTHKKQFLIIGNQNAFSYKEIFHDIQLNLIWTGYNMVKKFYQPDGSIKEFGNVCWFTNLITTKRSEELIFTKKYADNPKDYPKYDSCNAINVSKVAYIPGDYDGVMGVPITFLDKYNPDQFIVLGLDDPDLEYPEWRGRGPELNGKTIYRRVMIKRK